MSKKKMTITEIRERLGNRQGKKFWRTLDELGKTPEFNQYLEEEYPHGATPMTAKEELSRRDFLKLMGASLVMAMIPGCSRQPLEKIVPYVSAPEEIIPGKPLYFATSMPFNGASTGLLVESHMGRPTKIEGNPAQVDSLGATSAIHQASLLGLYDPDRSNGVLQAGQPDNFDNFTQFIREELEANDGIQMHILSERIVSPTLADQVERLLEKHSSISWHQYEPIHRDLARKAQKMVFGKYVDCVYEFESAQTILSLGSNFLDDTPGHLRYTREFTAKRKVVDEKLTDMNRLYVIESTPTITGASADHLLARNSQRMTLMTAALANILGVKVPSSVSGQLTAEEKKWVHALADDLAHGRGKSLVIAGDRAPLIVQVMTHQINAKLGNVNKTVRYIDPIESRPELMSKSLKRLNKAMSKGEVETLIILNSNPVYSAPKDLKFKENLKKVLNTIHFGLYQDETATECKWHIPSRHYLEMFSDGRASDGTVTMCQPLIHPLYNGISIHELMNVFLGEDKIDDHDIVYNYWKAKSKALDFNSVWRKALHDGHIPKTAFKSIKVEQQSEFNKEDLKELAVASGSQVTDLELILNPDPSIWDGRFANNGWLQELPKPLTKITWDNALWVSPATAEQLNLANEDVVEVTYQNRRLSLPIWIVPGHSDQTVSAFLGYGRKKCGEVGHRKGFDTFTLASLDQPWSLPGVEISKVGLTYPIASTQIHHSMHGRDLVRSATMDEYKDHPNFAHAHSHGGDDGELSMYPKHPDRAPDQWGMAINLNQCVGCNACVTACQSENNTPIVGKKEVGRGREMHWIRVDNYYEGELDEPDVHHQPVMCMHCENAPCEPVCPVQATGHTDEGLNEMVYNRCVGTRYCSNNCPYKVRRFNFFQYADKNSETDKLRSNPDVTIRNRGVMEKCTFCVQRINQARITAKKENRPIAEGEVVTACQSVCPAQAISFGNIRDSKSQVSQMKQSPLNYGLLTELNTFPRLSYLAKVKNPNPKLVVHQSTIGHAADKHHAPGGAKH